MFRTIKLVILLHVEVKALCMQMLTSFHKNLITKLNQDTSLHSAAYTTIGSIAIQGVRQSNVSVGSKVAVIGLGLVGQLTAQILKANGCMVIGIDINDYAIDIASGEETWSIDHGFNANNADAIDKIRSITKGFWN